MGSELIWGWCQRLVSRWRRQLSPDSWSRNNFIQLKNQPKWIEPNAMVAHLIIFRYWSVLGDSSVLGLPNQEICSQLPSGTQTQQLKSNHLKMIFFNHPLSFVFLAFPSYLWLPTKPIPKSIALLAVTTLQPSGIRRGYSACTKHSRTKLTRQAVIIISESYPRRIKGTENGRHLSKMVDVWWRNFWSFEMDVAHFSNYIYIYTVHTYIHTYIHI